MICLSSAGILSQGKVRYRLFVLPQESWVDFTITMIHSRRSETNPPSYYHRTEQSWDNPSLSGIRLSHTRSSEPREHEQQPKHTMERNSIFHDPFCTLCVCVCPSSIRTPRPQESPEEIDTHQGTENKSIHPKQSRESYESTTMLLDDGSLHRCEMIQIIRHVGNSDQTSKWHDTEVAYA